MGMSSLAYAPGGMHAAAGIDPLTAGLVSHEPLRLVR